MASSSQRITLNLNLIVIIVMVGCPIFVLSWDKINSIRAIQEKVRECRALNHDVNNNNTARETRFYYDMMVGFHLQSAVMLIHESDISNILRQRLHEDFKLAVLPQRVEIVTNESSSTMTDIGNRWTGYIILSDLSKVKRILSEVSPKNRGKAIVLAFNYA